MDDQATRLRMLVEGKITKEDTMDSGRLQGSSQSMTYQPVSQGARVIAITSGKGGVGKTNLTVNLAIAMGKKGKRVVVVDADLGTANVDVLLGTSSRQTMMSLVNEGAYTGALRSQLYIWWLWYGACRGAVYYSKAGYF